MGIRNWLMLPANGIARFQTLVRAAIDGNTAATIDLNNEVIAARGVKPDLNARISGTIDPSGNLLANAPTVGFWALDARIATRVDATHISFAIDVTADYLPSRAVMIVYADNTKTEHHVQTAIFATGVTTVTLGGALSVVEMAISQVFYATSKPSNAPAVGNFQNLPVASTAGASDLIAIDQAGLKKVATVSQIRAELQPASPNLDDWAANSRASVTASIDAASPNKDIASLPTVTTAVGTDTVAILQGGTHKKITVQNLAQTVPPTVELRTTDYSAILANLGKEWFRSDIGGKYFVDAVPTGAWSAGPNTIAQRFASAGCGSKTKTLVAGGRGPLSSMEKSDSVAWSSVSSLGTARSDTQGVGNSDDALICPGYTNGTPSFVTDKFDGVTRSAGPDWTDALWGYAMGGITKSACASFGGINGNSGAISRCTRFDGVTTSTIANAYPFAANSPAGGIGDITACAIIAGTNGASDTGTIYKFDNVVFSLICSLLSSRTMSASSGLGVLSDAVIAGGNSAGANQKYAYKLIGNSLTALPDLPIAVHWPAATGSGAASAVSIGGQSGGFAVNYLNIPSFIVRKFATT